MEGGGDTAAQKAELRQGFDGLLDRLKSSARDKRLGWRVVPCGARQAAYDAFINAVEANPERSNVLLVDSETLVAPCIGHGGEDAPVRVAHLGQSDGWDLSTVNPQAVHLMAQCMEAWVVADPASLSSFYGQRFLSNALPVRANLEEEPKQDVYHKLERATTATQKGAYRKIAHAGRLLQKIDSQMIEQRCPRFAEFTRWLNGTIITAH